MRANRWGAAGKSALGAVRGANSSLFISSELVSDLSLILRVQHYTMYTVSSHSVPFIRILSLHSHPSPSSFFFFFSVFDAQFFLVRVIRRQDPLDRGAAAHTKGVEARNSLKQLESI